jgi:hypothetical protein
VLTATDDHLSLRLDNKDLVLGPSQMDSFVSSHRELNRYLFKFERDENGAVEGVNHGPRWFINLSCGGPMEFEIPEAWSAYTGRYRSYSPWFPYFEIFTRKDQLVAVIGTGTESGSTPQKAEDSEHTQPEGPLDQRTPVR